MIYCVSDIHGCFDLFTGMLDVIDFKDEDTLYILGDIVDRGPDGLKTILDIFDRKNIISLLGNHDQTALAVMGGLMSNPSKEQIELIRSIMRSWYKDGGDATYTEFKKLTNLERLVAVDYFNRMITHMEIEVGGKRYYLSHSLPDKERFSETNMLTTDDYLWGEPDYDEVYRQDTFFVTGHTPTGLIDPKYAKLIYMENNHIAIDCGAYFTGTLGCIRLDDLKCFYCSDNS